MSETLHIKWRWDNEFICNIWLSTSSSLIIIWMIFEICLHFVIYCDNYFFFINILFNHLMSISKWDFFLTILLSTRAALSLPTASSKLLDVSASTCSSATVVKKGNESAAPLNTRNAKNKFVLVAKPSFCVFPPVFATNVLASERETVFARERWRTEAKPLAQAELIESNTASTVSIDFTPDRTAGKLFTS